MTTAPMNTKAKKNSNVVRIGSHSDAFTMPSYAVQ